MEFYQRKTSTGIGFIPLVDVVFILLLLFIVAFKFSSWELVSVKDMGALKPTPTEPELDLQPEAELEPKLDPQSEPELMVEATPASVAEPLSNAVAATAKVSEEKYVSSIIEHFNKSLIYPQIAKSRNWQGEVLLSIKVGKNGGLRLVRVDKTSGHALLDQAAVDAVRKATPLPAPHAVYTDFVVPIVFALP